MEQGGFRAGEEGVAQAAALHTATTSCVHARQVVIVGFLDLRKAYDMVPHEILFEKLERLGIHGRLLDLIKAFYTDARARVICSAGTSEFFTILRGILQGTVTGPILFNLFAHDMFGSLAERLHGCTNTQLSAFQFADDTAPIAAAKTAQDAAKKMRTILNQLDTWAPANLMSWGPGSKLMVYSQTAVSVTTLGSFQLGGHALEFTDKQVYLGLEFTNDLAKSQHHMAMDRAGTAQGRIDALSPCMANTAIPLVHRQPLLRSVYYPSLMYGCEVWGNRDSRDAEWSPTKLKHIDGALQRALTLLITGHPPGKVKLPTRSFYIPPVSAVPALRDLGMHSAFSFARAMGVRQMIKYNHDPNLATAYTIMAQTNGDSDKHPNQLLRGAARGQRQSINALAIHWTAFSNWWHDRDRESSPDFSPKMARNRAYNVFDRKFADLKRSGSRSQRWNEKHGLDRPEASIDALYAHPHLDRALQCVLTIRLGAFPFDRTTCNKCPCCQAQLPASEYIWDHWAQRGGCRAMRDARRSLRKAFRAERQETTAAVRMRQPFRNRDRVRYSPANILKGRVIPEDIRLALDIRPWAPRLTNAITDFFSQPVCALRKQFSGIRIMPGF